MSCMTPSWRLNFDGDVRIVRLRGRHRQWWLSPSTPMADRTRSERCHPPGARRTPSSQLAKLLTEAYDGGTAHHQQEGSGNHHHH
ncbi:unnamed protein product, partial [Trichogramma brassicae]